VGIKARLFGRNNKEVHTFYPMDNHTGLNGSPDVLGMATLPQAHGVFKSATRTEAGTTIIATPRLNQSILLTDLLISGEKQAGSTVTVRFTDGTYTVDIFVASQVDAPPQIAIPLSGRWQGWKNARLEVVTSGAADATVAIGYMKVPTGLPYEEWDSLR
jgi:hypothetical protein